jgi:hypothetical protein
MKMKLVVPQDVKDVAVKAAETHLACELGGSDKKLFCIVLDAVFKHMSQNPRVPPKEQWMKLYGEAKTGAEACAAWQRIQWLVPDVPDAVKALILPESGPPVTASAYNEGLIAGYWLGLDAQGKEAQ